MILVIAEKPSVAQTIAAVLGAKEKKDGFLTGSGYIVSWCVGHLVGLSEAAAYGEQYKKWSYDSLPILPQEWKYTVASDKEKQFKTLKELMHRQTFPKSSMPATRGARENSFSVLSTKLPGAGSPRAACGFPQWKKLLSKRAFLI